MDEMSSNGIGLFGYIILFVIIVWVFGGAFGGNGFGFGRNGYSYGYPTNWDAVTPLDVYKDVCAFEKGNIADIAATQKEIDVQADATRDMIMAQTNVLQAQMNAQQIQNLRDVVNDRDREIAKLQNQLFTKDQLAPITAQLNAIQNNMLVRPNVTGVGVACPSAAILNGLGVNQLPNYQYPGAIV